jgi:hypothetical protein
MIRKLLASLVVAASLSSPVLGQNELAVVNVTVIDGTDRLPRDHATVLGRDERSFRYPAKATPYLKQ